MRRLAKASSAAPNQGQWRLWLLSGLIAVSMSLLTGSALAAETRPYTGTSFGPDGVGGSATFSNLQGVAVDQASGNVYAYDSAAGKVYKFDAAGAPVNFSGLSGNVIEGVGGAGNGEEELAVAPAGSPGGTAGNIYVANNFVIKIYAPSGTLLGELTGGETCGVAVNPAGHVFVGVYPSTVREYVPSANPPTNADLVSTSTASLPGICNVAADGAGNVYAANYTGAEVVKLEGIADTTPAAFGAGGATLVVDPASNDLYADRGSLFAQYDSAGNLLGTSGLGQLQASRGIAINSSLDRVYAGNGGSGKVDVFGAAIIVPGVSMQAPTNVTGKKATLNATVNPAGLAVTSCTFEYGTTESYGQSAPCEGAIPTDETDHPVDATILGLTPNTTYHYRIVAANANGSGVSEDRTLTTNLPAVTQPATAVAAHRATLNGSVFPEGEAVTSCTFQYGSSEALGQSIPCEGAIPTDENGHAVTAPITGLKSNTTYYFRIVAANANGTNQGVLRNFTTNQPAVTEAATEVSGSKATLHGTVFPEGEAVTTCTFEYGTTLAYGQTAPCEGSIPADEAGHSVSAQIAHLSPNGRVYHFRLVIDGDNGLVRGTDQTFSTGTTVITGPPSAITDTTVTVGGTLNPEGTPYTECSFEYGLTTAYGQSVPCSESPAEVGSGNVPVSVHANLAALERGTTYHYRLVGTNADGAARGTDESFQTLGAVIEASWASTVVVSEAILQARINPRGSATTYHLEYGPDSSYGESTTERTVGADGTGHTVTESLEGLETNTTYHYRFVATNSIGTSNGSDHTFITHPPFAPNADCANQGVRYGTAARLPDCRAYEMVSPVDKNNTDIVSLININSNPATLDQASVDGNRISYTTSQGFGDTQGVPYVSQYMASRGTDGWNNHSITPPQGVHSPTSIGNRIDVEFRAFSPDLCSSVLLYPTDTPLAAGAEEGALNIYRRTNCGTESYEWAGGTLNSSDSLLLSGDGRCVLSGHLNETCGGTTRRVSVLPNGEATEGDAGSQDGYEFRSGTKLTSISTDGSRVYWNKNENLYLRINATQEQSALNGTNECTEPQKACTLDISATVPAGRAHFWSASPDGSKAIFSVDNFSNNVLLYEFDLSQPESPTLLADGLWTRGGGIVTAILGAGTDPTNVTFISGNMLSGPNAEGKEPTAGAPNLYMHDADETRFIATLSNDDMAGLFRISSFSPQAYQKIGRVSPDGLHAVFGSTAPLTGYDATDANTGNRELEVYYYDGTADGGAGALRCVSCNPTNQRPTGEIVLVDGYGSEESRAAAYVPPYWTETHGPRAITDDGKRVFFNSFDALLPRDTNGKGDVYEWEAPGSGDCTEDSSSYRSLNGGCLSLISSGESPSDSMLIDASADGRDVFFTTAASLLPQDPGLIDIYDAREGGGFPLPPSPAPACEGEACQSTPEPPDDPTPASSAFNGAGNLRGEGKARCSKGKSRRKGRCVATKRKKHVKPARKRSANHDRRHAR